MNICVGCGIEFDGLTRAKKRCWRCSMSRENEKNKKAQAKRWLMPRAHQALHTAIRKGFVRPVRGLSCVDCGVPAECYDHRDYTKPFDVEPVCIRCNKLRGSAFPYNRPDLLELVGIQ